MKISWVWWWAPVNPATWEAEAGESLEPVNPATQEAEVAVSQDHATVLQPGQQEQNKTKPQTRKENTHVNRTAD